ncbi:hypothetical protein CO676_32440 [Sinorhizobium sp. BJ1]|nr:hypothetical protein CO676_32440 [Sinorhizobium sp. BJ1]
MARSTDSPVDCARLQGRLFDYPQGGHQHCVRPGDTRPFTRRVRRRLPFAPDDLAHDSGLPKAPASATSFSIGHNVSRRSEVDEVMEEAAGAGARIVKPAEKTFYGGHAGYFTDPDGHLWEVVWNPADLPPEGRGD